VRACVHLVMVFVTLRRVCERENAIEKQLRVVELQDSIEIGRVKSLHSIFVTMSILVLIYSIISIYTHFACKHISVKFCDSSNQTSISSLNVSSDFGQDNLKVSVVKESIKEVQTVPIVAINPVQVIRSDPDDFDNSDLAEVIKILTETLFYLFQYSRKFVFLRPASHTTFFDTILRYKDKKTSFCLQYFILPCELGGDIFGKRVCFQNILK
jgi:hypothetical protein